MRAVTGLLWLLAFGTQAVHSFTSVVFSPVAQCGSFRVNFTGGFMPAVLPLVLTIVPFDDVPISIPISSSSWDNATSTGAAVTFLPLRAGTFFVASLDDSQGNPTGPTSDIIRVQESRNETCVPPIDTAPRRKVFTIDGTIGQCQPFNVTFDPAVVMQTPTVRGFIPIGPGSFLKQGKEYESPGVQEFVLAGLHGFQVALLVDDGAGHRETTKLTPIAGDSLSPLSCIDFPKPTQSAIIGASQNTSGTEMLSGPVKIIIGVVCGGVVGSVAVLMVIFVLRKRRAATPQSPRDPESPNGSFSSSSSDSKTFSFTEDISVGSFFNSVNRSGNNNNGVAPRVAPSRTSFICPLAAINESPMSKTSEMARGERESYRSQPRSTRRRSDVSSDSNPFSNSQRVRSFEKERDLDEKSEYQEEIARTPPTTPPAALSANSTTSSPQTGQSMLMSDGSGRSRRPCPDAPLPAVPLSPISRIDSTELRQYGSIGRFITSTNSSILTTGSTSSRNRAVLANIRLQMGSAPSTPVPREREDSGRR